MGKEEKVLYLTIDKEVSLRFGDQGKRLTHIRLTPNKVAEILHNGLVTAETIFEMKTVYLITRSNFRTPVKLEGSPELVEDTLVKVPINQKNTKKIFGQKNLWVVPYFEFTVSSDQQISYEELFILANLNRYYHEEKTEKKKRNKRRYYVNND